MAPTPAPEDCGGAWGYEMLKREQRDDDVPDEESILGPNFDPTAFDLKAVSEYIEQDFNRKR
jgi:hypothetical protein